MHSCNISSLLENVLNATNVAILIGLCFFVASDTFSSRKRSVTSRACGKPHSMTHSQNAGAQPPLQESTTSSWLATTGSEFLLSQIASVYAGRLPHRAVLSTEKLSGFLIGLSATSDVECMTTCMTTFSVSHLKTILKIVSSALFCLSEFLTF